MVKKKTPPSRAQTTPSTRARKPTKPSHKYPTPRAKAKPRQEQQRRPSFITRKYPRLTGEGARLYKEAQAKLSYEERYPAPWHRPAVTKGHALLLAMAAFFMLLMAILVYYIPAWGMVDYVPYALGQGIGGWGGYMLSRLCRWERPFPSGHYKRLDSNHTALWWSITMGGIIAIQIFTYTFTQLTANTFLVGAYIIFAGATESQLFHIAFVDVGGTLGRLITRRHWGEILGKLLTIPGSDWLFMSIHTEYMGNPIALFTVVLVGTWFAVVYTISDNADSVLLAHLAWNLLMVIKFGGVVPA